MEWNDQYRDTVRDFWRRHTSGVRTVATRLAGSSDLYADDGRSPYASVNFVTAHDGFTLRDLVSYEHKHNEANGEHNRDGTDNNRSWNCGVEGETDDPAVLALRRRQAANLMVTLCLSNGVPMLTAGDERGRTQGGNNNAYGQDNETSWIDWRAEDAWLDVYEITKTALRLRRDHPALRQRHWFEGRPAIKGGPKDLAWMHPDGREMTHRRLARRRPAHGGDVRLRRPAPLPRPARGAAAGLLVRHLAQRVVRGRRGPAAGERLGPQGRGGAVDLPGQPHRHPGLLRRHAGAAVPLGRGAQGGQGMRVREIPVFRHPCADLLIVQLLGILIYPFLNDRPLGRALFSIFALLVLALAVFAVRMTPALSWISAGLGLPVVVLTIWEAVSPGVESVVLWSSAFHAAFYLYTAYALLRYMFEDHVVTADEIYATGATFTVGPGASPTSTSSSR